LLPLLAAQTLRASEWQLIIVDDGSSDQTRSVVKRHSASLDITLVVLDPKGRCASRARNVGAECAQSPYLLFLDPDILPAAGLLEAHLKRLSSPLAVSLGYMFAVGLGQDVFERTYGDNWDFADIATTLERARKLPGLSDQRWSWCTADNAFSGLPCPWAGGWTGNIGLSRELFVRVGRFDEAFVDRGMEDIDLAYRLHLANATFELNDDATGFHYPHPKDHSRTGDADSQNSFTLLRKYPEPAIELLKVLSCAQLNTALPKIRSVLPSYQGATTLDLRPVLQRADGNVRSYCIAGTYPLSVTMPEGKLMKFTGLSTKQTTEGCALPLIGLATPFHPGAFDIAVVVDSWMTLPYSIAAIQLEELSRIAGTVIAVSTIAEGAASRRLQECEEEFEVSPWQQGRADAAFVIRPRNSPRSHQELFIDHVPPSVEDRGTVRLWRVST
jgi:GT2 family glycosyltransferase